MNTQITGFSDYCNRKKRFAQLMFKNEKQGMEHIGARIRQARKERQLSQLALGRAVGRSQSTVGEWETGENSPHRDVIPKLAKELRVSVEWLEFGGDAKPARQPVIGIPLRGRSQAGYWAEPEFFEYNEHPDENTENELVPVIPVTDYPTEQQYGLELVGTSLNKVAPSGAFAHCVSLDYFPGGSDPKRLDGLLVHVERQRGDLCETTVKRFKRNGRKSELWPDSDDPKHQAPLALDDGKPGSVRILGVVIGIYRFTV